MAIQQNFPSTRPSLNLNFARSKKLDPRITFTRTSSATYVGEDGLIKIAPANEARFDHDPITGESLGLLVEEARTNLIIRSEEFETANWSKSNGTVTSNQAVSPSGTTTADTFITNIVTALNFIQQVRSVTSGTIYTWSVYLKSAGYSWVFMDAFDGSNHRTWFNISDGVIGTVQAGNTSTITPVGNGWYRCTLTRSTGSTSTNYAVAVVSGNDAQTISGDGTSGIYIWGAQLEVGAFPTSYIPTTASTVTRTADSASMTGTNFSSWYRQDAGTVFASFTSPVPTSVSVAAAIVNFDDGTASNRFSPCFYVSSTRQVAANQLTLGVTNYTLTAASEVDLKNTQKSATALSFGNYGMSANGLTPVTSSSAVTLPTVNTLRFGLRIGGIQANATIRQLTYYPSRLPNQQLINLTK
jgi:hypothetical protein